MIKKIIGTLMGLVCIVHNANAQLSVDTLNVERLDEVVVTDTKLRIKRENSGKVITTITSEDLKRYLGASVADVLNTVVGVEINGSRSYEGQNLNYYVRGGRNRQVVILIDGVQLTDPSQIANDYDLRLLQTEQVESIEVLKGAASTLYGSGASTAVINIKLKQAAKKPLAINLSSVAGTNNTQNDSDYSDLSFRNSASISGSSDKLNYKLGIAHIYSDGMSAIASGSDEDVYRAFNTNLQLGYSLNNRVKLKAYYNFNQFKTDFDDSFGMMDADNVLESKQNRFGIISELKYKNGELFVNAAINTINREIESAFPARFEGDTYVIDAYNNFVPNDAFSLTTGINFIQNSMQSFSVPFGATDLEEGINPDEANFTIIDPYVNVLYTSDFGLNVNAGLRLNNHSEYGSHLVYNLNPSYRFKLGNNLIKLLGSYSTAYITPSLFQLFEPAFGNADLEPEENRTIEAGATYDTDIFEFGLVYFNRKEENFVDFVDLGDFQFQYSNSENDFTATGLEFSSSILISEAINFNANLTYTKVEEELDLRIPEIKVNSSLSYKITDRLLSRLDFQYNDERNDVFTDPTTFESNRVVLDSYSLFDLYLNYELSKDVFNVFFNFNNIFNSEYTEVVGFNTKGRNVSLGLNLNL